MSTGKLCGLAIIIVAIAPIVLGMVWPTGTETVETWEAQPGIDITGDLADREIRVYDSYVGPLNNLSILRTGGDVLSFPSPRATTTTPNSYPVGEVASTETTQTVDFQALASSGMARFAFGSSTGMTYTGDARTYTYADYWPATNVLILYDDTPVRTATPQIGDVLTGSITAVSYQGTGEYMDPGAGLAGSATAWLWTNGMSNREVELWIRMTATPFTNQIRVDTLTLTMDGGMVSVTDGTATEDIGSAYSFVRVILREDGTATVTGLIGVDGFLDAAYTEGNSVELQGSGELDGIPMQGAYMSWLVKRTVSAIGTTRGIDSSGFAPDGYFPGHAWQVTIVNPSTFGPSLTIGSVTLPVEDGAVRLQDPETGEDVTEQVRGMRILSLVQGGQQQIYVNGIRILTQAPASVTITMDGQWYTSVVLSEVVQGTHENYTWTPGAFGFDQQSFCIVGLLACVLVCIAGTLWGRVTGESTLALYITMAICGAAYFVML